MELVKDFNSSEKQPGLLEIKELCLDLGMALWITLVVLSNYKKNQFIKANLKLTTEDSLSVVKCWPNVCKISWKELMF